jgi:hypothetical protein
MTHGDESTTLIDMTKRLQVLLADEELAGIQQRARQRHQTTAAWVRDAIRDATEVQDAAAQQEIARKLAAIEKAYKYSFPTADIDQMLDEIERGYLEKLLE